MILKNLIGLKVETQSGVELGTVKDIAIEIESQSVTHYEVQKFLGKILLISREQVISFQGNKIVVDENLVRKKGEDLMEDVSTIAI